jgi:ABC-type glycerol-3-phosphate transport system permease component
LRRGDFVKAVKMKIDLGRSFKAGLVHLILILACILSLIPVLWVVLTSLQPASAITRYPPSLVPSGLYLNNFKFALFQNPVLRYMLNSVIVGVATTAAVAAVASLAAYAFARFRFPFRKTGFFAILATQMLPPLTNIIPLYILMQHLRLLNSLQSLILVYVAMTLPLAIWILAGFFQSLPKELEEAATIDGCNRLGVFLRVALPLSLPGIAAVSIITFVIAWNEFVIALTLISNQNLRTYQFGLYDFLKFEMAGWMPRDMAVGLLGAASVMGLIPTFIAYLFVQKGFIAGMTRGAIK